MAKVIDEQLLIRVFIGESDSYGHQPLYKAIVEMLRESGVAGATVLKGVGGFGGHSIYHTDHILRLSQDLPIVIEVVDSKEKIDEVLPKLDEMVEEGLITLEKVRVVKYTHRKR